MSGSNPDSGLFFLNLLVEDLPGFWRLIYTLVRDDRERTLVILEVVNHEEYDEWFPGRER